MNCLGIILGSVWNHLGIAFGHIFSPPPHHFYRLMPGFTYISIQSQRSQRTIKLATLSTQAPSLLAPSFPVEYPPPSKLQAWPPAWPPASWPPASQWSIPRPRSCQLGPQLGAQPLGPQLPSGVSIALEVTSLAPSLLGPSLPVEYPPPSKLRAWPPALAPSLLAPSFPMAGRGSQEHSGRLRASERPPESNFRVYFVYFFNDFRHLFICSFG